MTRYRFPRARLLQFVKYPLPGRVKTRLGTVLNEGDILRLHEHLALHTAELLRDSRLAPYHLWHDAPSMSAGDRFLAEFGAVAVHLQQGEDLGQRMHRALASTLSEPGVEVAVLVGSDCPFLDEGRLVQALIWLEQGTDAVFGPALDGGYYLVGLSRPCEALFRDIDWGSDRVWHQTRERLADRRLSWRELAPLPDIDRPEDLSLLDSVFGAFVGKWEK